MAISIKTYSFKRDCCRLHSIFVRVEQFPHIVFRHAISLAVPHFSIWQDNVRRWRMPQDHSRISNFECMFL